ncbi:hypothetical protein HCH03_13860, partial [Gordonibacter massiliensis]|nr:hypothetical protein [Gordonibacter massiliensis (ex Traore et al. 2017)]
MDTSNWTTERVIAIARLACSLAASVAAGCGLALDADALYIGVTCVLATACYAW